MRAVVQRVSSASVTVEGQTVGAIQHGFLILLGVEEEDTQTDVAWMAAKVTGLRVFEDEDGKMNLDLKQTKGNALVVSQFTLLGDCRKGRRPSFVAAARPEKARSLYESFVAELKGQDIPTETGTFQAQMNVSLVNDGPVTLLLDSQRRF
ncbi:MAG TPA: D-tyrosyl-tRNA(Tyr) deacylase [Planctomycetaceae bacterium]|nr:D-tyrosyl-tRNA(Tyr) deacylase [Planctomycetaceae bacterium]